MHKRAFEPDFYKASSMDFSCSFNDEWKVVALHMLPERRDGLEDEKGEDDFPEVGEEVDKIGDGFIKEYFIEGIGRAMPLT